MTLEGFLTDVIVQDHRSGRDGPLSARGRELLWRLKRVNELDAEIDTAPAWGAALSARLEERDGLARALGLPLRVTPAQRLPTGTMMLQLPPGSRVDYLQTEAATLMTISPEREPGEDEPPYPELDGGSDAE